MHVHTLANVIVSLISQTRNQSIPKICGESDQTQGVIWDETKRGCCNEGQCSQEVVSCFRDRARNIPFSTHQRLCAASDHCMHPDPPPATEDYYAKSMQWRRHGRPRLVVGFAFFTCVVLFKACKLKAWFQAYSGTVGSLLLTINVEV